MYGQLGENFFPKLVTGSDLNKATSAPALGSQRKVRVQDSGASTLMAHLTYRVSFSPTRCPVLGVTDLP